MKNGESRKEGPPGAAALPGENRDRRPSPFFIEEWRVDPLSGEIARGDEVRSLEPRVMDLLVRLADRAGDVVERDELKRVVWGDPETSEEALRRAVWELRNGLGDDPQHPRFIETIRKGGYRLIAPVVRAEDAPEAPPERRRLWWWAVPVAIVAAAAAWFLIPRDFSSPEPKVLRGAPLTSYPGKETAPALSPDGTRVAFSWDGEERGNTDIYVKALDRETPLRLTDDPLPETYAAWSPDGTRIAFARLGDLQKVCVVPASGGAVDTLYSLRPALVGLDWSPDGRWLAFSAWGEEGMPPRIVLLDIETGEIRAMTNPTPQYSCDFMPRFSPDGSTIAFIRSGPIFQQDVHLISLEGGQPRRLTRSQGRIEGMDWAPEGRDIVFAAKAKTGYDLLRVGARGGAVVRVPTTARSAAHPSVASPGGLLVYEETKSAADIWRLALGEGADAEPEPVIRSTASDAAPCYSPDGKHFAFLSTRSGYTEVWTANADGSGQRQVTRFRGAQPVDPSWSPDGTRLVLTVARDDSTFLYEIDERGAHARCLVEGGADVVFAAACSRRDGSFYYERGDSLGWEIRRYGPEGDASEKVAPHEGMVLRETEEGDLVVWRFERGGIWRLPPGGGEGERLIEPEEMSYWTSLQAVPGGIYFSLLTRRGPLIAFWDEAEGSQRIVARLPENALSWFSISPDGNEALFSRAETRETDLILCRGFR
ncbi:MAG: PD40 domain-containing protein [Candidatus Eisenbacteria bacterium]|nr:PD40 domain-containing protein [Candidatus Eisenbacteria bacterium]